ncbi:hypothetical protein [Peribacillus alkalitolerans]|uniref:hypothetical protein n=1 Tax=Peribacillus alkalitolerans TaxID=1550385 RepID=UPI0013D69469|nr:hypothetical protein [Peribacillus alkalitolerans]
MPYVVENMSIVQNGFLQKTNLVVKENRIYSMYTPVNRLKFIRMDLDKYIMTPTNVYLYSMDKELDSGLWRKMLQLGADTLLAIFKIDFEFHIQTQYKQTIEQLKDFPLDYSIGLKIPIHLLSSKVIRFCKREKIPTIFVEVETYESMHKLAWERVKEDLFPYQSVLIPIFTGESKQNVNLEKKWKELMEDHRIPTAFVSHLFNQNLSLQNLKKFGLYPKKGFLHIGGELNYNLYRKEEVDTKYVVNESNYDKIDFTVFKNTVVRAGDNFYQPDGLGERLDIKVPGFFQ